jgi:hypothetical protein
MAFMRALEKERPASERLFEDPYAALFSAGGDVAAPRAPVRDLEALVAIEFVGLDLRKGNERGTKGAIGGVEEDYPLVGVRNNSIGVHRSLPVWLAHLNDASAAVIDDPSGGS